MPAETSRLTSARLAESCLTVAFDDVRIEPAVGLGKRQRCRLKHPVVEPAVGPHRVCNRRGGNSGSVYCGSDAGIVADEAGLTGVDQRRGNPRVCRKRAPTVL